MAILRSIQKAKFEEMGITGNALDALLRETSKARHESRVKDAKIAAVTAAKNCLYKGSANTPDEDAFWRPIFALWGAGLCLLDQVGIGGRDGVSGDATDRVPGLDVLGKGRKQASDGGAWDAAIKEAGIDLAKESGYYGGIDAYSGKYTGFYNIVIIPVLPKDGIWTHDGKNWGRSEGGIGILMPHNTTYNEDGEVETDNTVIPVPIIDIDVSGRYIRDYRWHYSLARECLRRVTLNESWHSDLEIDVRGTPEEWAIVVNTLKDIMKLDEFESEIISYWFNDPEAMGTKKDSSGTTWVVTNVKCDREKIPDCVRILRVLNMDLVNTYEVTYPLKEYGQFWELR